MKSLFKFSSLKKKKLASRALLQKHVKLNKFLKRNF